MFGLDRLFDLNRDGNLSSSERAVLFLAMDEETDKEADSQNGKRLENHQKSKTDRRKDGKQAL
jgi:hypothetical protein